MVIKDTNNKQDMLKLQQIGGDRIYNIYSVSLDNAIVVNNGKAVLSVLLMGNKIVNSQSIELILEYDNLKTAQQIQLIEELSKDIAKKYHQIQEMTKINIDICKDIEGGLLND